MQRRLLSLFLVAFLGVAGTGAVRAADEPSFTRTEDVIYGRKFGTALTMDVFTPKKNANGAAVIWVVSGGWFSSHENIPVNLIKEFVGRGYTVFAVVHGSQPRFTIPDILHDMNRAVRFIRAHAGDWKIDPDRIGISGGSAGGHLSLMQATAGDLGNPRARDPIERVSSRVQVVACFYPPTDFLNYGARARMPSAGASWRITASPSTCASSTPRPRPWNGSRRKPKSSSWVEGFRPSRT